nr:hypothetical protein [Tanacetum cinerariifolium]
MPPTMTTRSAGRPDVASRGRGTGGRVSRGGGKTKGHSGDQGDDQVGDQGRGQGNGAIVYARWIEKMDSVQDMSGCRDS